MHCSCNYTKKSGKHKKIDGVCFLLFDSFCRNHEISSRNRPGPGKGIRTKDGTAYFTSTLPPSPPFGLPIATCGEEEEEEEEDQRPSREEGKDFPETQLRP